MENDFPSFDAMTKKLYSVRNWLVVYKNIWTRHLTARTVDVMVDIAKKAHNPNEIVEDSDGRPVNVAKRLELRKILVQDAIDLLAQIDVLIAELPDREKNEELVADLELFAKNHWSAEALAVAPDMIPTKPAAPAAPAVEEAPKKEDEGKEPSDEAKV